MIYFFDYGGEIMKIGIFDSGIGGVTVLHEALKQMPEEDYVYYADTLNVPYGVKPKELVKEYVLEAVSFIYGLGVDAVVIACNTATSIAIEELRNIYDIPILGMEPAVKPAVEKSAVNNKRVLVTATPLTIKEEKLKNLITRLNNEAIVDLLPLPRLVEFAENLRFDDEEVKIYLKEELSCFDLSKYGTIVLGCTHFPYYRNIFKALIENEVDIIDGNTGTINNLKRILGEMNNLTRGSGRIAYYKSGKIVTEEKEINKFEYLLKRAALAYSK